MELHNCLLKYSLLLHISPYFNETALALKHYAGHILGMVGPVDMEVKDMHSMDARSTVWYLWPHSWPWSWIFKVKLRVWNNLSQEWKAPLTSKITDGSQLEARPLWDLELWPWPWICKVKSWNYHISGKQGPVDVEWKGCEWIGCWIPRLAPSH